MKKRLVISTLILTIFLTANISAGIYFSQPEDYYNLGDILKSNITIEPVEKGFLTIYLNCDNDELIITPSSYQNGKATIDFPLTTAWIENMTGTCYFFAEYPNGVNGKSRDFKISKKLDVSLSIDSLFAKPGEEITIEGYAKRLNGVGINGEVEIAIPLLKLSEKINQTQQNETNETQESSEQTSEEQTSEETDKNEIFYGKVKDGKFTISFNLPKDIAAGEYRIEALAYEEQEGIKTSEGMARANLKIFQILTSIDIALNNQNINPGETLSFKPMLMDQTKKSIENEISIIITDEKSKRVFEKIFQSDETINYQIPTNQTAGYYDITASSNELTATKRFYINEKQIISFEIKNETLVVTNIGNIPYKKDIQIELNGKPFVRKLDLKLGEVYEFKLTGSNQEYDIKISDGETELQQQGVALTGHAIGVNEVNNRLPLSVKPIIWTFLIIVLGGGLIFLLRNIIKKKSFAYYGQGKNNQNKIITLKPSVEISQKKQTTPLIPPNQAEQVLILKGEKSKATLVVLKIKNKISKFSKQSLERAIEPVYEKRGAVYEQGDHIFIIFSPLMTKNIKTEIVAANCTKKIQTILKDHNKKFKDKIEFGISINSGEIINKIEDKKLKFTALGKLMTAGKRLAGLSDEQILVTKEAYERGINEIKVEKKKINETEVYELRTIVDYEKNQKFLKKFIERTKEK